MLVNLKLKIILGEDSHFLIDALGAERPPEEEHHL
jgi:hypothetical protein